MTIHDLGVTSTNTSARALSLKEVASLLGLSYSTVYANRQRLGFFKVGGAWRVWPEKLRERTTGYNERRPAHVDERGTAWDSTGEKDQTFGTSISARQAVNALDKRLAQQTKRRRENSKQR